ncbi:serine/threonine-protein kinase [Nocardia aurantiaca]|uniref:non-specific serine/threonine protein kinase n=1 Tax=Nocardia aurantiaca TaxID=2675850 RepID=A0A6I3KRF8_9NOCA|nr:serine/threonine-protein kinase [Nocardia aurantiaca]MTE12057.1 protein kinase [Nocardia aurantiaca]
MADLKPGEDIAGYVIERWIGAGGSGTVYAARHPRLPRLAAVKVFNRDEVTADAEGWRRFEREADITARFDHPNIVSVYDRGLDDGRLWIAMQFVEGPDADSLSGLAPERALRVGSGIASALDYAHGKGVLHRDVKPSNIMLSPAEDGRPERALLTDFGIARLRDETTHVTRTGDISATFAFASPEQVSGRFLDPRTDQYSLACTLFVLLTGCRPFLATDLAGLIYAHTSTPPLHVSQVRPDLPGGFDAVFDRALAKHPDERFPSCADFTDAVWQVWRVASTPTVSDTPPIGFVTDPGVPRSPRTDPTVLRSPRTDPTVLRSPRTDPTVLGPGHYHTDPGAPAYGVAYGANAGSFEDAAPHRHRAPEPARGGAGVGRGVVTGLLAVLAAAVIGGSAVLVTVNLESHGRTSGAPVSAAVPTVATAVSSVATSIAAVPPSTLAGRVPQDFVGEWSGTSDSNADDYRLVIRQGNLNDAVVTSTVLRGSRPLCVFDYRLLGVPGAGDITVGAGTVISGGSSCSPQDTHELVLSNGRITRALSVSGYVTYTRVK